MYNAVKWHEAYIPHNKQLQVKSPYTGQTWASQQTPKTSYKPVFVAGMLQSLDEKLQFEFLSF